MKKIKETIKNEWFEFKLLLKNVPSWVLALFVISVIGMNLLANKSINTNLDWLALDCGITLSWLSFLTMDLLVKKFGAKASIEISILAIIFNLFVSLIFLAASAIPGAWGESFTSNGEAINTALNNTFAGTWYVLLGSTVAFVVSSILNGLLNVLVGKIFKKRPDSFFAFATRSYISTMIAQFVDNLIFALIVSLNFFGWSITQCLMCALTGAVVELLCEVVFSPICYFVLKKWNKDNVGGEYIEFINSKNKICETENKE